MFKKEKTQIEFVSLVEGVTDAYPIVPSNEYKPKWTETAYKEFKGLISQGPVFNHVTLCPGIFDLYKSNSGFIVPAWHDVLVRTNGDGKTIQWAVPNFEGLEIEGVNQPVGSHTEDIMQHMPRRPHSLKGVIKFNTPWRIIAPKGIKFLMMPVPYDDQQVFESSIGILDPSISNEINVQVYWNVLNGEEKIKAGTPLCYLLPITERNLSYVVRDRTPHDISWEHKKNYLMSSTFFPNRKKLADMWYKHFKK